MAGIADSVRHTRAEESARLRRTYVMEHFEADLKAGRIDVWYQPVVRLQTRGVCGAEALVRWDSPMYGLMLPKNFLPILEEAGLVAMLDRHVLNCVARQCHKFLEDGDTRFLPLSVNISTQSFQKMDVPSVYFDICREYGLTLGMIELEVRGSVPAAQVSRLRSLGVRVWADGFGGANSSVSILADSPYDAVKLSVRLMRGLEHQSQKRTIVESLVGLAKRLDVLTVAKGVENKEQLEVLRETGCEKVQGYLICRPAPLSYLPQAIKRAGISFEPEASHSYYDATSRINLIAGSYREATGEARVEVGAVPMAIVELSNNVAHYLAANANYLAFLRQTDLDGIEAADAILNDPNEEIYKELRRAATAARDTGVDQAIGYSRFDQYHQTFVHYIASDVARNAWSVLISTVDLSRFDRSSLYAVTSMSSSSAIMMTKETLWDSLLTMEHMGFFWKDRQRRFVGVSPYFLRYYGFDSIDDILGKTDEDVGWHVDPNPFKNDEYLVIKEGQKVIEAHGTCIVGGEIHEIVANKVPVYQHGQIVGLLGNFRDVTNSATAANIGAEYGMRSTDAQRKDVVSSLAGMVGAQITPSGSLPHGYRSSAGRRGVFGGISDRDEEMPGPEFGALADLFLVYRAAYERNGADFLVCAVRVQGLRELSETRGADVAHTAIETFITKIGYMMHNSGVYDQLTDDTILIIKQFELGGDGDIFIENLRSIPLLLGDIDGAPVNLGVKVVGVRYATCGNLRTLREVMRRRLGETTSVKLDDEEQTSKESSKES